jgi:hypothetical protein
VSGAATLSSTLTVSSRLTLNGVGTSEIYTTDASGLYLTAATSGGMYIASESRFIFRKATSPFTEYMRIESTGNVGIGTLSPSDLLHIGNSTTGGNLRVVSSSYGSNGVARFFGTDNVEKLQIGALGTNDSFLFTPSGVSLSIFTGGSERMRITSGGNLLVGTTSDAGFRLDVNGTARVSDTLSVTSNTSTSYALNIIGRTTAGNASTINFFNNAASTRYGFVYVDSSTFEIGSITGSNIPLIFSTNQSERLRITSGGNVGIGTSSPSASAILQADSTTRGFLPPRMTTTQKNAISTPAQGLMVFDTTLVKLCVYNGTTWETITSI